MFRQSERLTLGKSALFSSYDGNLAMFDVLHFYPYLTN